MSCTQYQQKNTRGETQPEFASPDNATNKTEFKATDQPKLKERGAQKRTNKNQRRELQKREWSNQKLEETRLMRNQAWQDSRKAVHQGLERQMFLNSDERSLSLAN
jgi:hypothetical protein